MKIPNIVLIVDNEAGVRESTRLRLETKGYHVFVAKTSDEARQILKSERVYLAIIDVRLQDDNDPNDVSGLDLAAELGPEVAKIILTGFQTTELTRRALIGYLNQVAPAEDVIAKQDGPRKLLETVKRVFDSQVRNKINFSLRIQYDGGLTPQTLMAPLEKASSIDSLEEVEVEELLRRLFRRASEVKLYYIPPGRGGTSVVRAKPIYNGVEGSSFVVKFGPVEQINKEISAYRECVEPFAFRHATVLIGQPMRTHHLAGCKLLFVGCSIDNPQDFNTFYRDQSISDEKLQQAIWNIFAQTCGIWYKGKQERKAYDGSLCEFMARKLSFDLSSDDSESDDSEMEAALNNLLDGKPFRRVTFDRTSPQRFRARIDGVEEELPDPLFVVTHLQERLPKPSFAAITHGDLNGRNMFVDEAGCTWLIDFYRTGWGPALRDAAELESAIKFELIHSTNLPALLAFERAAVTSTAFGEKLTLPRRASSKEFQRALAAIHAVREAAFEIAETECMDEYYALLLFYALKMMTWKGISSVDMKRQPLRQRHALYSAALLSAKFAPQDKPKDEVHIV